MALYELTFAVSDLISKSWPVEFDLAEGRQHRAVSGT